MSTNQINHRNLEKIGLDVAENLGSHIFYKTYFPFGDPYGVPANKMSKFCVTYSEDMAAWCVGLVDSDGSIVVVRSVQEIDEITTLFTAITGQSIQDYDTIHH